TTHANKPTRTLLAADSCRNPYPYPKTQAYYRVECWGAVPGCQRRSEAGITDLAALPLHNERANCAFFDGHVEGMKTNITAIRCVRHLGKAGNDNIWDFEK